MTFYATYVKECALQPQCELLKINSQAEYRETNKHAVAEIFPVIE